MYIRNISYPFSVRCICRKVSIQSIFVLMQLFVSIFYDSEFLVIGLFLHNVQISFSDFYEYLFSQTTTRHIYSYMYCHYFSDNIGYALPIIIQNILQIYVFFLQVFIASGKVPFCRYLLQPPAFFLRPKSGQIRSKLPFPATVPPALQSGTQGQTGRKKRRTFWLAYSFNTSIIFANMRFYFCLYYIYC